MKKQETLDTVWKVPDDLWEEIEPVVLEMAPPNHLSAAVGGGFGIDTGVDTWRDREYIHDTRNGYRLAVRRIERVGGSARLYKRRQVRESHSENMHKTGEP